jgi:hypothetical protein
LLGDGLVVETVIQFQITLFWCYIYTSKEVNRTKFTICVFWTLRFNIFNCKLTLSIKFTWRDITDNFHGVFFLLKHNLLCNLKKLSFLIHIKVCYFLNLWRKFFLKQNLFLLILKLFFTNLKKKFSQKFRYRNSYLRIILKFKIIIL